MGAQAFANYTIAYHVIENAAPFDVVFLNGNLASSRWWQPTLEALKSTPGYSAARNKGRIILFELPGCGESSTINGELSVPEITQQYIDLAKKLNVTSAGLVGHSTGGLLSCWLLALAPEIFKKALLLDPVGAQGIQFEDLVLEKYEEMKASPELTAAIIAFTIHNCDQTSDHFQKVIAPDTFKSVNQVGSKMIRALRNYNSEDTIKKIKGSVMILFGEKDVLLPKADAQALAQMIPNAKFMEVPDTGHCLNVENPKLMASYIQEYLFQ